MADEPIRVLIVSSDSMENLQQEIIDVLLMNENFKLMGIAKGIDEAIASGNRSHPHIFLVSEMVQNGDVISLIKRLTKTFPVSASILFSENDSPMFLREAMLAGIRQVIKRPVNADELCQKLHLIYRNLNPIKKIC